MYRCTPISTRPTLLVPYARPFRSFRVKQARGLGAHFLVEHRAAVAAMGLGPVHRRVRLAQHVLALAIARLPQRDADAGRREQFAPGDPQRRSDEHTAELQSLMRNSYAVFCTEKKNKIKLSYIRQ